MYAIRSYYVQLVVGIAAKSDEHLQILTNLTDVLGDPAEVARLAATSDPREIASRLSEGAPRPTVAASAPEDFADHFDVIISSPHGLHARPATALVEVAKVV